MKKDFQSDSENSEPEEKSMAHYGLIYFVANVLNRSAALVLIPLYTHVLTLAEYGIYAMVLAVSDVVAIFFGMGVTSAMGRLYFDSYNQSDHVNASRLVVSTAFLSMLALSMVVLVLAFPIAQVLVAVGYTEPKYLNLFASLLLILQKSYLQLSYRKSLRSKHY